jgi:hypothetical protein
VVSFSNSERGGVFDGDRFSDAASGAEGGFDFHEPRLDDGDQVVHDFIGDVLVEDSLVAEALQVDLQALELDAFFVGRVGDRDGAEVGLAGLRADRGELGRDDFDLVIAGGKLVFECFQQRAKVGHWAAPVDGPCIVA